MSQRLLTEAEKLAADNLTSELRELLRNQTFSMLNVVLGTGPEAIGVEKAIEMLAAA